MGHSSARRMLYLVRLAVGEESNTSHTRTASKVSVFLVRQMMDDGREVIRLC